MMKQILNPHTTNTIKDFSILFIRIAVGLLLLAHGYPKLQALLSGEPVQFASIMGMSATVSLTLAMLAEFLCVLLVMVGSFTRMAALFIVLEMLVIVFYVHGDDPITKRELPILYLVTYIYILFMGPGKHSIDFILHRKFYGRRRISYN